MALALQKRCHKCNNPLTLIIVVLSALIINIRFMWYMFYETRVIQGNPIFNKVSVDVSSNYKQTTPRSFALINASQFVNIHIRNDSTTFKSGESLSWERVYYRGNASCPMSKPHQALPVLPLFETGWSAGPKLYHNDKVRQTRHTSTNEHEAYHKLDAIKALLSGDAFRVNLPYQPLEAKTNIVLDRIRMSAATGVVFLNDRYFSVASFGMKTVYLYEYNMQNRTYRLCDSILNTPSSEGGFPMFIDIIDYDGNDLIITSNLRTGTQTLFKVDLETETLTHFKHVAAFSGLRQWCHGVRFYPYAKTTNIILATTNNHEYPKSLMVRFYDWVEETVLGQYNFAGTAHAGFKAQDVFFMDKQNILVPLTTNLVLVNTMDCHHVSKDIERFVTRLLHLRIHFDVESIANGTRSMAKRREFEEIAWIDIMDAHPDSIYFRDGVALLSDQFNDRVTFVAVDPTGQTPMRHIRNETGYMMPHGVAMSNTMDIMAVGCYGDNSVILKPIEKDVIKHFSKGKQT